MITAAALCPSPPLLHPALTGRDAVLPELRAACVQAVSWLLRDDPGEIVVVGPAAMSGEWDAAGRLDSLAYAPGPGRPDPAAAPAAGPGRLDPAAAPAADSGEAPPRSLPLSLGLGAMLLDQVGYEGRRRLLAVGQDEPASACAGLGASLSSTPASVLASASVSAASAPAAPLSAAPLSAASASAASASAASASASAASASAASASAASASAVSGRTALLVMGDGSARRNLKAPGYLDPRAAAFDAEVERAIRAGDLGALLRLDQALARDLMATGRPAWQVLAGAMRELTPVAEVLYCGDPFGVAYLVACLRPRGPAGHR